MLALVSECDRACRELAQSVIEEEIVEQNPEDKLDPDEEEELQVAAK
jgi:hypothetical protein